MFVKVGHIVGKKSLEDSRKYLRPEVVAQLSSIELRARLVVEGFITGLHKSPYHGFSVEFAEHRQYQTGDDLRYMDWKIVGRSGRYYVKQFEEETNLRAMIFLDCSGSMRYQSKGHIRKFDYGAYVAAALAMLMMKQQDAVGLALYDRSVRSFLPSRSKQSYIRELIKSIGSAEPSEQTGTAEALNGLAERMGRRGLAIIISDFFDDTDSIVQALKHFRHRHHEVIAMQILDPRELDFRLGSDVTLIDMETGEKLMTQPQHIGASYREALLAHNATIKRECFQRGIDYILIDTSQPFDIALREYLARRRRL